MVSLSAPSFDLSGELILKRTEGSSLSSAARRVSRSATLDGGAVFLDRGYTDADRDLVVSAAGISQADFERATYLLESYSQLLVSTERGLFLCAPVGLRLTDGDLVFNLFVVSKEGA